VVEDGPARLVSSPVAAPSRPDTYGTKVTPRPAATSMTWAERRRPARPRARIRQEDRDGAAARRSRHARLGPPSRGRRRGGDRGSRACDGKDPRKCRLSRIPEGAPREAATGLSRSLNRAARICHFSHDLLNPEPPLDGVRGERQPPVEPADLHSDLADEAHLCRHWACC
jgi:hypothetical protein